MPLPGERQPYHNPNWGGARPGSGRPRLILPETVVDVRYLARLYGGGPYNAHRRRQARGVADVAFHKKCGIAITEMVKSPWVYRRLRNFRAGIEAAISCFKRAYGAARCIWRGLDHFKAYIWSAVVAHNLVLFARLKPV